MLAALSRRRSRVQIPSGPLDRGPPAPVPGQVAQSVERAAENRKVGGSIPSLPTRFAQVSRLAAGTPLLDEPTDSGIFQAEGSPTTDTDIWLPLAALVLGWGLSQVTEVLKDRRASNRDRLARQVELQRNTLLSLQDALLELSTAANAARHADAIATIKGPGEEERRRSAHLERQRLRSAEANAELLCSRFEDEQTRVFTTLAIAAADLLVPYDEQKSQESMTNARNSYRETIDRIGELDPH